MCCWMFTVILTFFLLHSKFILKSHLVMDFTYICQACPWLILIIISIENYFHEISIEVNVSLTIKLVLVWAFKKKSA